MNHRIEDDERDALAGLNSVLPHRKVHSCSQQVRATSAQKRHPKVRKHSLDDDRIPENINCLHDSSDDDCFPYSSNNHAASPADNYLSHRLSMDGGSGLDDFPQCQPLPEFIGSGGGTGIFKVPIRAPVHPGRPPCLELRPHPLRETQVGKFLRNIACTETQLWAGQESGVRVWKFEKAYEPGGRLRSRVRRGDEDAAPFHESVHTSPTMCLTVDSGNMLVWTGHKNGKIRSWKMDQPLDDTPFKEGLSWQAHRGPVLAIVFTTYGDLWSGSEGGVIRIWPWESIEKSLSLSPEERNMAALLVERSYIGLRNQVTINGASSISSQEVKCLLSDSVRSRVWCAGPLSFSLWDARTKELLKVFNIDGQIENRVDMSSVQEDQAAEDDMKVKFVSTSKKEKSQGTSFLQRSRNVIMGAADAVRRVATKVAGAFVEDTERTEALVLSNDGMIWSGCTNGLLVQWDGNGTRIQDFNHYPCAVQCFCTFDVGIVVVGLREVEMGAGFLAISAAKETVGLEGSAVGQCWLDTIGKALEEGKSFERMGSRQLAGLLISLWVRKNLRTHVGDIDAAAVPCGFGHASGNKGGVGLRIRVYDRIMCFVNCHLAAHLEAVNRRNSDFDHIYRNMVFTRSSNILNTAAGMAPYLFLSCSLAFSTYLFGCFTLLACHWSSLLQPVSQQLFTCFVAMGVNSEEAKPELAEADMVVFFGDFNYWLFGISYDEARDFVSQRCFDWLREKDQLRAEMKTGKVFQGMREALIKFPPTYKFERHNAGLAGYDSGEKKRIPAWCDRIIYRDNRLAQVFDCNLDCPVVSSILQYEACMEVTDSDHKPIRCKFNVKIAHADRSIRRKEFGEIIKSNEKIRSTLEELCYVPETTVSTNPIVLQNQDTSPLQITNKSMKDKAIYKIFCDGQSTVKDGKDAPEFCPRGAFGFPQWLEVL